MTEDRRDKTSFLEPIDYSGENFGPLYDELPLWSAPFGLLLLDRVPMRRQGTLLDVGAGTGFLTVELAQRWGAGARVIAVDNWKAATNHLRWKIERLGLDNVEVIDSDAEAIDLPRNTVDVVVSNLGINNFEHPDAVLAACHRVAKSGARMLITSNLVGHMAEFYEIFRSTLIEMDLTACLPELEAHVSHRATVDSIRTLLQRNGFHVLEIKTAAFRSRFSDGSSLLRHHFIRLGFLPAWKVIVPDRAAEEAFTTLEGKLNAHAAQHGELTLTIPMALVDAQKVDPQ